MSGRGRGIRPKGKPVAAASNASKVPALPMVNIASTDPSKRITEFISEGDKCPVCNSDRYINPRLRLLVNKCFHRICESCVDRLFTLGPEPCPTCGTELRKTGFSAQTFENLGVEKEVNIRKRIARCFNKRREDFPDLKTYNDYLEEVEDITFNLINSVDVAATEAKIKAYQQANAALIAKNARIETSESTVQQKKEAREKAERAERRRIIEQLQQEEDALRSKNEKSLIEQLEKTTNDTDAARLYRQARKQAAQKRKEAEEIPEEWARLMMAPSADPMDVDQVEDTRFDPEADLSNWDDYSNMFTLPPVAVGYPSDPWSTFTKKEEEWVIRAQVAGFRKEAFWERVVRSGVQGLFVAPVH